MINRLYEWYGKKVVLSTMVVIVVLVVSGAFIYIFKASPVTIEEVDTTAHVEVKKVSDIAFVNSFSSVGTVEAISEARLQTESGGRVTSVTTEIGKRVGAGSVIATIENSSQRASLLQAEGAYDAAVAGAQSSQVGVGGAQTAVQTSLDSAVTTYQSSYITIEGILHNTVDELFSIQNGTANGLKIDGRGQSPQIIAERNSIETTLTQWSVAKNSVTTVSIPSQLDTSRAFTQRVSSFIETLSALVNEQKLTDSYTQDDKDTLEAKLYAARVSLNAVTQQLDGASTQIINANKALEQAQIAGSQSVPSAATAQVKIALGSLRAAQANYEKTLVRTPISGVVNALYLKTGEYVSPSQQAAIIANNNGLQVSTSVNDSEQSKIKIGDEVIIDSTNKGVITAIAGSVDPTTGKVAVKVSVDDSTTLTNGSIVTISFTQEKLEENSEIIIPLSSLKMTGSGPVAFEVTSENKIASLPVTLGTIKGDSVVVTKGLTFDSEIVVDARGLKEGEAVTIITK